MSSTGNTPVTAPDLAGKTVAEPRTDEPKTEAMAQAAAGPAVPKRLGGFEIDRLLGRGGMGAVYLARQVNLDRRVVLKVIAPELAADPVLVERLQREARAAGRIAHDNVVQVHDTGRDGDVPWIAMEYVDGDSLAAILARKKTLPHREATRLMIGAAQGLRAAHEAGVLHRDVKPANILVTKDGRVKVADFGLAKLGSAPRADDTHADTPVAKPTPGKDPGLSNDKLLGTPAYMAPEQAACGPVDERADIYSLGATYYELLTGRRPFEAATALKTLALVLAGGMRPPREHVPTIPRAVEAACLRLMAFDRQERPRHAKEAIALLEGLLATPSAPVVVARPAAREPERGLNAIVIFFAAVLLSATFFVVTKMRRPEDKARPSPSSTISDPSAPGVSMPDQPAPDSPDDEQRRWELEKQRRELEWARDAEEARRRGAAEPPPPEKERDDGLRAARAERARAEREAEERRRQAEDDAETRRREQQAAEEAQRVLRRK